MKAVHGLENLEILSDLASGFLKLLCAKISTSKSQRLLDSECRLRP